MQKNKFALYKRYFKRIGGILGALFFINVISQVLNYMYVQDDLWGRILWHHFYEDNGKIDNLYLGSSHVYCDINPMLLDEINGQYNFNLATAAQRLNDSYYCLKEADKNNSLSHVYLELYYWCNVKDNFGSDSDMIDTYNFFIWENLDYMRPSFNKIEYVVSVFEPEKYIEVLFPFSRFRANLDNWDYIKKTVNDKASEEYRTYKHHNDWNTEGNLYDEYLQQGRWYSTGVLLDNQRLFEQNRILQEKPMGEKSEKYLREIIFYCQKREIPITLFVSPVNELQIISTEHYDNYFNQVKDIAEEYGIDFYDFNLAKEKYFSIQQGEYFRDIGHLNGVGADKFTRFFTEIIANDALENKKYFYDSYEEKLSDTSPTLYGLYYRDFVTQEEAQETMRTYWVASNREAGMEYKIILTPNEKEEYMVQDFAENKKFILSPDEHGICIVTARMKDQPDKLEIMEINY